MGLQAPVHPHRPWLVHCLLALGLVPYAGIALLPYVQDDWFFLSEPSPLSAFVPGRTPFYRPLGYAYFALVAHLELPAVGHRVVAGLLLLMQGLLIERLLRWAGLDRRVSITTSVAFLAAAALHVDTMTWLAGAFQLGGQTTWLASLYLFACGRLRWSAVVFGASLLFKEQGACLWAVLLFVASPTDARPSHATSRVRRWIHTRLWPTRYHVVVLAAFFALVAHSQHVLELPAHHPYAVDVLGTHVVSLALLYLGWLGESWVAGVNGLFVVLVVAATIAAGLLARGGRRAQHPGRPIQWSLLTAWALVPAIPLLAFPNHAYRYYLSYAAPALTALAMVGLTRVLSAAGQRYIYGLALVPIVSSTLWVERQLADGLDAPFVPGTNDLLRRARTVAIVRPGLQRLVPPLAPGAVLVFDGADIASFAWSVGPRHWTLDPTLSVYAAEDLRLQGLTGGKPELRRISDGDVVPGDRARLLAIQDGRLTEIPWASASGLK